MDMINHRLRENNFKEIQVLGRDTNNKLVIYSLIYIHIRYTSIYNLTFRYKKQSNSSKILSRL